MGAANSGADPIVSSLDCGVPVGELWTKTKLLKGRCRYGDPILNRVVKSRGARESEPWEMREMGIRDEKRCTESALIRLGWITVAKLFRTVTSRSFSCHLVYNTMLFLLAALAVNICSDTERLAQGRDWIEYMEKSQPDYPTLPTAYSVESAMGLPGKAFQALTGAPIMKPSIDVCHRESFQKERGVDLGSVMTIHHHSLRPKIQFRRSSAKPALIPLQSSPQSGTYRRRR